jgi:nicotinate-nucleotide adenylyltransferase
VRRVAASLSASDRLYFLTGADAFLDLPHWREWVALLDACDFIIVSRPGFPIAEIAKVVPPELRTGTETERSIPLRRSTLHLLTTVEADVSSSEIRRRAAQGKPLTGLVPDAVADYIRKLGLFLDEHHAD